MEISDGYDVVIPYGNYDSYTLCAVANDIINPLLVSLGISFNITYDITTNKFDFELLGSLPDVGQPQSITIQFTGFSYILWGFKESVTKHLIETTLTSQSMIDLSGTRFLFVQSPTFSTANINSKTGSTNQVLAKIPITQDYLAIQQYVNNGFQNKITINAMNISVIEIVILDEYLNDINFNGSDWSLTLNITILGKSPEELVTIGPEQFSA